MSDTVIRAEGIGKEYIIGARERQTETFREMLLNTCKAPVRRLRSLRGQVASERRFWALDDVSFEVNRGEVVGIIGRNGAGKSTLLKVLSRITEPTRGRVEVRGRIASLLEVGTGFHSELTGRENIFLNGAILGMSRREINKKFDEIIAFAEIDRFLDTPVKRYSSGMYVRLAFSVAAHLEPEILLVDEVLAVGDSAFQRKCLGKMEDVAGSGRTVLFVSHNMAAVRSLCSKGVVLRTAKIAFQGAIDSALDFYLKEDTLGDSSVNWTKQDAPQCEEVRLWRAHIEGPDGRPVTILETRERFTIVLEYEVLAPVQGMRVGFLMQNAQGVLICGSTDFDAASNNNKYPGVYTSRCEFPGEVLNSGRYSILFGVDRPPYMTQMIKSPYCLSFDIEDLDGHGPLQQRLPGVIKPTVHWKDDTRQAVSG